MMIAELPLLADRATGIRRANENTNKNTYEIPWATNYLKCSTQFRNVEPNKLNERLPFF